VNENENFIFGDELSLKNDRGLQKRQDTEHCSTRKNKITESIIEEIRRRRLSSWFDTYPERRLIDYQPELFIAMLLENAAKEDKQKRGSKTSRKTSNYGIYNLKMP